MFDLRFGPVDHDQLEDLADHMARTDRIECRAAGHDSPLRALQVSVAASPTTFGAYDVYGRLQGVFGVAPVSLISDTGRPWLLKREGSSVYRRAYVTQSRRYLAQMATPYRQLENWASAEALDSLRWLRWLGFTVEDPKKLGVHGEMLCRFWKVI